MKSERLDWLADNPLYTKRFAFFVGRRCRETPIKEVAEELFLDWHTVKELDKQYLREQPAPPGRQPRSTGHRHRRNRHRQGAPVPHRGQRPGARPGHLVRWQGPLRSESPSLDEFFAWLGPQKCRRIRLAVLDMWKAFRNSTRKEGNAPQAAILYDKFHVLKHLGAAMDKVRKREYARVSGADRRFIKGQRYTLLSHWENLSLQGRKALQLLFKANKRLNKAYLLKESFDQLWDYKSPGWARRFFDNWRDALRWQRLQPFQKFARMIEAHWDGIEAYCHEENKVALGFVEGLNNKIRVIQRRA